MGFVVTSPCLGTGQRLAVSALAVGGPDWCYTATPLLTPASRGPKQGRKALSFPKGGTSGASEVKKFAAGSRQLLQTISVKAISKEAKNPYAMKVTPERQLGST